MNTNEPGRFAWIRANSWANKLPSYRIASFWFLRALGFVYFCAFVSLWLQVGGLIGHDGILPIASLMERAAGQVGFWELPTLCWLNASDGFLQAQCALGTLFSLLLMAGLVPALCAPASWLLYLSLTVAGQQFLSFQWDALLLETGFLGIWLTPLVLRSRLATDPPPSRIAVLLVQLLLFKLMFLSGYVKLRSNDEAWWDLTALTYHYWTQCLPAWPAWYADKLPLWFQKFSCGLMFAIELGLPLFIWGPGRILRRLAFGGLVGLQVLIAMTGNYTFFNLLTCALCLLILDDRCCSGRSQSGLYKGLRWPWWIVGPVAIPILIVSFMIFSGTLRWRVPWPRWTVALHESVRSFRSINGYGLFAVMTKSRLEIIVEGSDDGVTWLPYEFKWKPGDPARRPGYVAPHQPRLDWQMWFAALSDYQHQPWFIQFLVKLLEGAPPVLDLLESNPFPDQPPRYLRASAYDYHFSTREERQTRRNMVDARTARFILPSNFIEERRFMKTRWMILAALALASCAKQERVSLKDVVTQTTVRADKASLTPCSNLVQRGNFGVGLTGDGVMILETGVVYRVDADGRAGRAPADATVSFALATFFETDRSYDIGDMDYNVFRNTLDWKRAAPGRIYAVRVSGNFGRITLGDRPEIHDVRGAMLGFFYPEYMRGVNDPGYDLYFLDAGQSSGGPVTDFTITQGRIELDECTALLVDLPSTL